MRDVLRPIQDGHLALTSAVNSIYMLQTEMAATVHGMLEEYMSWRRGAQGIGEEESDSVIDYHESMRQSLLRSLEVPTITNITVNRTSRGYTGRADITATASHPEDVAQISYAFRRGSGANIYSGGDLFSKGRSTRMSLHSFADNASETSQNWAVYVRARGPLGNSATRSASFDLAVATAGRNDAPDGFVADVMPEDTSPPPRPILSFPEYKRAADDQSVSRWWSNEPGRIVFAAMSADAESDIAGYEYRIGTTPGGNEVRDWTEGVGVPLIEAGQEGVVGNAIRRFTVHGLTLEEGVPYYISVRARNGAGLLSSVQSDTRGVMVDTSPPTAPGEGSPVVVLGPEPSAEGSAMKVTGPVVSNPPAYSGPSSATTQPVAPSFEVRWTAASDPESGIRTYEYVVSTENDPQGAFEEIPALPPGVFYLGPITRSPVSRTSSTSATITGAPLDYMKDVYVHVRAVNNAGSPGEVLTVGPVRPVDPTAPVHPNLAAMIDASGVRVYLTRPGYDLESSVKGYQFAVARRAGNGQTTWLRPFPSGTDVDFGPLCGSTGGGLMMIPVDAAGQPLPPDRTGCVVPYDQDTAPYHLIPARHFVSRTGPRGGRDNIQVAPLSGQDEDRYYVYVRTVNRQGYHSAYQSLAGPIIFDTTIPEEPTITSSTQTTSKRGPVLTVEVTDVRDPESGVAAVEYRFPDQGSNAWADFSSSPGGRKKSSSYTRTFQLRGADIPKSIEIRLTNGSGLQRVSSHCVRDCTPSLPLPLPPAVGSFTTPLTNVGTSIGTTPVVAPGVTAPRPTPPIRR